ncbi:flagellar biosynthesis protein FliR [Roseibium aestuarii]|uniref:Flagellar biosynthesis protein FliR n=1 Tax=Roseibium aestuarii TaxID=2600299 RepID=A0ABW4JUL7_9HYPH|nr:flagellar biosynthesis protein FliR [Roseibium aestuarii]
MTGAGFITAQFGPEVLIATFLVFCRVGTCLMIIPGFASARIAMQIRLFVAIAVTLALSPSLVPQVRAVLPDLELATLARLILAELLVGFFIGLLGRVLLAALETLATFVSMAIGLSNMPGVPVEGGEALPSLANLITLSATAMIFITDQHLELVRALAVSYSTLPPGEGLEAAAGLARLTDQLTAAFVLALRVTSPFVVYTVVVNLAVGLVNKLTPQIPVYFIAMPFVIAGGMYLLFLLGAEGILLFLDGYATWLKTG